MEYRLSLTPRLLAVGVCAIMALLVLLFALGFQVGQNMAATVPAAAAAAATNRAAAGPAGPAGPPGLADTRVAPAAGVAAPAEVAGRYTRPTGEAP